MNALEQQIETDRKVTYWRTLLRQALADNSTVDFHNLSPAAVDNLALIAAMAVVKELSE